MDRRRLLYRLRFLLFSRSGSKGILSAKVLSKEFRQISKGLGCIGLFFLIGLGLLFGAPRRIVILHRHRIPGCIAKHAHSAVFSHRLFRLGTGLIAKHTNRTVLRLLFPDRGSAGTEGTNRSLLRRLPVISGLGAVTEPDQRLPHLGRIPESVLRVISAGFQDDFLQAPAAVHRRGNRLSAEPALPGSFFFRRLGHLRRQGQERRPPLVHGPVQHQAQGIQVRGGAVGSVQVHLRCHIFVSTDLRAADGFIRNLRHTEITQLIVTGFGHENILRLDIPMDNILIFTQDQGIAQVDAHTDHLLLVIPLAELAGQRSQQFHFDEHIPADAVIMLDIAHIVTVDHIGMALQIQHHSVFPDDLLQITLEVGSDALIIIAVTAQLLDLLHALGDTDHLQSRGFDPAVEIPPDLVHRTETALTDFPDDFPPGPKLIDLIHVILSLPV